MLSVIIKPARYKLVWVFAHLQYERIFLTLNCSIWKTEVSLLYWQVKPLESSAAKPITIIISKNTTVSRSICEIMFSVIHALINAMWLIRNGSITTDPSWATIAVLHIGVVEVTVMRTKTNAEFNTWLQLSFFKEESSFTYLSKSLLEAVLLCFQSGKTDVFLERWFIVGCSLQA